MIPKPQHIGPMTVAVRASFPWDQPAAFLDDEVGYLRVTVPMETIAATTQAADAYARKVGNLPGSVYRIPIDDDPGTIEAAGIAHGAAASVFGRPPEAAMVALLTSTGEVTWSHATHAGDLSDDLVEAMLRHASKSLAVEATKSGRGLVTHPKVTWSIIYDPAREAVGLPRRVLTSWKDAARNDFVRVDVTAGTRPLLYTPERTGKVPA